MNIVWGLTLFVISFIGFIGQAITAVWPLTAVKLGLTEPEADVDPTFYLDVRGEAFWDSLILWALRVAGLLLLLNNHIWPYFGLVGGGMYLYFAGRGDCGPQDDAAPGHPDRPPQIPAAHLRISDTLGISGPHHHYLGHCCITFILIEVRDD